jgi:hypothetical protein
MSRPAQKPRHTCKTFAGCTDCGAGDCHCSKAKQPSRADLHMLVERFHRVKDDLPADERHSHALALDDCLQTCQRADIERVRSHALANGLTWEAAEKALGVSLVHV